jgi:hypothetical protein
MYLPCMRCAVPYGQIIGCSVTNFFDNPFNNFHYMQEISLVCGALYPYGQIAGVP